MLSDRNSSAIVAVGDIDRARTFYRDVLGLPLLDERAGDVLGFRTGDTLLTVYRSDYAGTNQANAVTWAMQGDLVDTVNDLRGKGVTFERYDAMNDMDFQDGVYSSGPVKLAWFKDPDGNVLHLVEGM